MREIEVGEKEIVCLLRECSGKSTTMKTILGIVKPTRHVNSCARELTGSDPRVVRKGFPLNPGGFSRLSWESEMGLHARERLQHRGGNGRSLLLFPEGEGGPDGLCHVEQMLP
jgi:ABC-type branched-subunit amino acid transport system ATPase component